VIHQEPRRIQEETPMTINTILCPTDFSDRSKSALKTAAYFAKLTNASVLLLHVIEPVAVAADMSMAVPLSEHEIQHQTKEEMNLFAASPELIGLAVKTKLVVGGCSASIVKVAADEQADLIVMNSHGRTGVARMLLGSIAEEVVRKAASPVLIVKES
jgi:universal stress protein A